MKGWSQKNLKLQVNPERNMEETSSTVECIVFPSLC